MAQIVAQSASLRVKVVFFYPVNFCVNMCSCLDDVPIPSLTSCTVFELLKFFLIFGELSGIHTPHTIRPVGNLLASFGTFKL